MTDKPKTTSYALREIPADLLRRWKIRAAIEGVSQRDLILKALDVYLENNGVK